MVMDKNQEKRLNEYIVIQKGRNIGTGSTAMEGIRVL